MNVDYIEKMGFGGLRLPLKGNDIDYNQLNQMVDFYIEAGGRYFDTAHGYVNEKSEIAFRECLVKRYPRTSFLFADKLSNSYFKSEEEIRPLFEKQLECCGLDYFDYYLMHAQSAVLFEKYKKCRAYETALELKNEGKIRKIGISIHDKAEVLEKILTTYPWIDIVQIQLNYLDYNAPDVESGKMLEICRKYGKPVYVMEPVKGGSLIKLPTDAQAIFDAVNADKSEEDKVSNAAFAYRYAAGFPEVERVLSGVNTLEQIHENVAIFKNFKQLNECELEAIEKVCDIFRSKGSIQCTACRYCVAECPKHIAIPDLFACLNSKILFNDWNQGYYYHTVLTTGGRKASDCIKCGKCESVCPQHLKIRDLLISVAKEFEKIKEKPTSYSSIIPSIADLAERMTMAYRYGGDLFEYLDAKGVKEFDFIAEDEAFIFCLEMFQRFTRMPETAYYYGNVPQPAINWAKEKYGITIKSYNELVKTGLDKTMVSLCRWRYSLVKKIKDYNYNWISFGNLVDYTLYKNVIVKTCKKYAESLGAKVLMVKFPQANRVINQSPLEKYLSSNGIYGFTNQSLQYGLKREDIIDSPIIKLTKYKNYVRRSDYSSKNINVVNGYRVTTDTVTESKHTIWFFGSSVSYGVFADDAHTIESSLQRNLNEEFGYKNEWNVVNASNYSGNDVYDVVEYMKEQPIEKGDICIFNCEFPLNLLEQEEAIVDMVTYFRRPHEYGEIFVDINHMTGKGYCAQGKILFEVLKERGYLKKNVCSEGAAPIIVSEIDNALLTEDDTECLDQFISGIVCHKLVSGAIVMNCNPFTLGHRYLIEKAAAMVDRLFVFVVEEDSSYFSFEDRIDLVKKGTDDLKNVCVLPSGSYMISKKTFAAYSNKSELQDEIVDPSMDVEIFAKVIAPRMGITIRFAGEEPLDNVTRQYNDSMRRILPRNGIEFKVIKRKEQDGEPISASRVRKLLKDNNFIAIKNLVPETTYEYLVKEYGKESM